jgi:hypothetical protein
MESLQKNEPVERHERNGCMESLERIESMGDWRGQNPTVALKGTNPLRV